MFLDATSAKGLFQPSKSSPCRSIRQQEVGHTGPNRASFPLTAPSPDSCSPAPFLSTRISHLDLPLSWHWDQFHDNEDSTTAVINLGTYARTEVKRADANPNPNPNASPTPGESAQSPEARGAMRPLPCLGFDVDEKRKLLSVY